MECDNWLRRFAPRCSRQRDVTGDAWRAAAPPPAGLTGVDAARCRALEVLEDRL
jgi:hypothetical protein